MTPLATIIMPAYGGGPVMDRALRALGPALAAGHQLIVVDDATPGGLRSKLPPGTRLIVRDRNGGPGAARNDGVNEANTEIVVFIDADVEVHPDTIGRLVDALAATDGPDAVFGSYDDTPAHPTYVSRFRNLLHHYVHQHGQKEASTFWAGCGAFRREMFLRVGGFDVEMFAAPSVEDIELGYRVRRAGGRIELDPSIVATHLKAWTFGEMLRVDVFRRAIPWTRLLAAWPEFGNDLNVGAGQRLCALCAGVAVLAALATLLPSYRMWALGVFCAALLIVALMNGPFLRVLKRNGGWPLAIVGFLLHVFYYLYGASAFVVARLGMALCLLKPLHPRKLATPSESR